MAGYGEANDAESGYGEQVAAGGSSGTGSLTLTASGAAVVPAGGSGALALSGAGTSAGPAAGAATLALTGTGAIDFQPASGSASIALSAAGAAAARGSGTGALALSASGSATLGAGGTALLALSSTSAAAPLYVTDTSNALDGLDITFGGTATAVRPPAPVPAHLVLAEKYDKAIAYPQPVMDNGRPT